MESPVGISNFRTIIVETGVSGNHYLFVDKSLFVRDILANSSGVILITRPRRFGKTLNMSMLHHFLSSEVDGRPTKDLFNNLKIAAHPEYMQHQGKYPVIYLTFKDIKANNFAEAYESLQHQISKIYMQYKNPIFTSTEISEDEKKFYQEIIDRKATLTATKNALKDLTEYLYKVFSKQVVVLIDEYDTPIQTAYIENYYQEMIAFMRELLGAALKDNSYLHKAVLTGILRVSKESLFSGLNNLDCYSMLDSSYGEYFGFTESEVATSLAETKIDCNMTDVKTWYNGYQCGQAVVYNPWSIINYIKRRELSLYWVNTSDNTLIKELLINSSVNFKQQFATLMLDKPIEMLINENFAFTYLKEDETVIWALLLMAGYLKVTSSQRMEFGKLCQLEIPNKEVKTLYNAIIIKWLSGVNNAVIFNNFLTNFLAGDMSKFTDGLRTIMLQTFSVHDVTGTMPEKFYHGFMLGLTAGVDRRQYTIHSNKESGLGRYDIALIPNDASKLGVVLELKSLSKGDDSLLQKEADLALKQIDNKKYAAIMAQHNIKQCLKVGVAFSGKELAVAHRIDWL